MNQESYPSNPLVERGRRVLVLRRRESVPIIPLDKRLQNIQAKAKEGDYQAHLRLEAISKLLDPCFEFYDSDVARIVNKGYPVQVERGLQLYRLMSQLRLFCEPIGNATGIMCRIRLLDFEGLTWEKLLDCRTESLTLIHRIADRRSEILDGFDLLTEQERVLYHRLKPYFGGRKKPTLRSLALNLLGEDDDIYSERNVYNYLAAVQSFRELHRDELWFSWHFIAGVNSYNRNPRTIREHLTDVYIEVREHLKNLVLPTVSREMLQALRGLETGLASVSALEALRGVDTAWRSKDALEAIRGIGTTLVPKDILQTLLGGENAFLASIRSAHATLCKMAASSFVPFPMQAPCLKDLMPNPLPQLCFPADRK